MRTPTPLQALIDKYKNDYRIEFRGRRLTIPDTRGVSGDTILHLVAGVGTPEEVDLLVGAGADINSLGDMGYTPLHSAASRGSLKMVWHLLDLGADPTLCSEFEATPAETADVLERPEIAVFIRDFKKL